MKSLLALLLIISCSSFANDSNKRNATQSFQTTITVEQWNKFSVLEKEQYNWYWTYGNYWLDEQNRYEEQGDDINIRKCNAKWFECIYQQQCVIDGFYNTLITTQADLKANGKGVSFALTYREQGVFDAFENLKESIARDNRAGIAESTYTQTALAKFNKMAFDAGAIYPPSQTPTQPYSANVDITKSSAHETSSNSRHRASSGGSVYVRGYTRKDGTYVRSHFRSK
jgi:hypothetical protein